MSAARKLVMAAVAWAMVVGSAFAHYHFLHYTSRTGPFAPVPEKFNLKALPNQTLYFFVSAQGPEQMDPSDSLASIVSQIRLAASVWSSVESSTLRLSFGGLQTPGTPQSTPGIDIFFDEVPPGLVALAGPTTRADMVAGEDGAFVPIIRSVLILQKDLSQRPSYTDAFFMTVVHEMGHTLGLQHTLTSSVMSTQVTRATTRSEPLAPDDVAGISLLYPAEGFASSTGSISGRVTLAGQGVHLASVAAMSPGGPVVSTLADPDGYYRLSGLAPGQYYLYVHALPPPLQTGLGLADIILPVDPEGQPFAAGPPFETQFYPGTKEILQARPVQVRAGSTLEGFDFAVRERGPLEVYSVTTYSFPGSYAVKPAFVNVNSRRNFLVASGVGLTANNAPTPGLRVAVVGGSAFILEDGVKAYPPAPAFLQLDFRFNPFSGEGARHLVFSLNNDVYILPAGLNLVWKQPPSITSVTPGFDNSGRRIVHLTGSGLYPDTRVLFDGLPAGVISLDSLNGAMVVAPPQGASSHRAIVTALNSDGQNSLFLDALAPPSYTYDPAAPPFVSVTPSVLPAGTEAMVEVTGTNTNFLDGQTLVGFGSSDVVVRRVWVLAPNQLWANIHVARSASIGATRLTVVTGFETASQPLGLQIQPGDPAAPVMNPKLLNPATGQPSIYSGGQALMEVSNLPANPGAVTLTVNDQPARILSIEEGRIVFQVPAGLNLGPAELRLAVGTVQAGRIVVVIDPPPPVVLAVSPPGSVLDLSHPAAQGQILIVTVAGLADPGVVDSPERVRINLGGVEHTPISVSVSESNPNIHLVMFRISPEVPAGDRIPLIVTIDSRASQPVMIPVGGAG